MVDWISPCRVDFVALAGTNEAPRVLLVEVKGSHLWTSATSPAAIHARDVRLWTNAANTNSRTGVEFSSFVIVGADVDDVFSVADLERLDQTGRFLPGGAD